MANSKIVYFGKVLMDLTQDTVTPEKMLKGTKAHDKAGELIEGKIESKAAETYTPTTEDQTIAANQFIAGKQTIKGDANLDEKNIKAGVNLFGKTGTFTSDANATAAEILKDKTAYVDGEKVTGTMPNRGAVDGKISTKYGSYTVPNGHHDGSGKVTLDPEAIADLTPENIREGKNVLGVLGTHSSTEGVNAEEREVTPSESEQVITPDTTAGFNYLSKVIVAAIKYVESTNDAGGTTVTIGQ